MSKSRALCHYLGFVFLFIFLTPAVFAKELVVTEKDNGKTLNLQTEDTLSVRLEVQLGTGYLWEVKTYSKRTLIYLRAEEETGESEPGAASIQVFQFKVKAINKKSSFVTIVYHRPFDKKRTPAKVFKIRIKVS